MNHLENPIMPKPKKSESSSENELQKGDELGNGSGNENEVGDEPPENGTRNMNITEEARKDWKLVSLWNVKIEIIRNSIQKTMNETNASAAFFQQKLKSLEAQWRSINSTSDAIFLLLYTFFKRAHQRFSI